MKTVKWQMLKLPLRDKELYLFLQPNLTILASPEKIKNVSGLSCGVELFKQMVGANRYR